MAFLIAMSLGIVLFAGAYLAFRWQMSRQLLEKVDAAIDRHIDTLVEVRAFSARYDENGLLRSREWQEEIDRFLDSQVSATLTKREIRRLENRRPYFATWVARRVAESVARMPIYQ
ncbi:MAG: hypothetical protein ACLQJR_19790 [Stellaceae bacterium]